MDKSTIDTDIPVSKTFQQLGLTSKLLTTLNELGYESPTPIQEQSIPILLAGHDLLAQAQTGTGKTAAFALPILSLIDVALRQPQALVIVPTRELAIQVAEAFQSYAKQLSGFQVMPIYGGQDYKIQLRALQRGSQVIVGTPGRLMDHMRRGTLATDNLRILVLDEADEMLKMGFIHDVEWILTQIPQKHHTALFSATMPASIQKIAQKYLRDAQKVLIRSKKNSVSLIEQFYVSVSNNQKLDLLTRCLEMEDIQAAIIFTRTKTTSTELAEKLQARGYMASALNGDMAQGERKKVIDRIKRGSLDIIVATDVAARGIDVDRISHVINYDIPVDSESYIHRIGRTGRAGRKGKALLFVTPREHYLLRNIEQATSRPIAALQPPTLKEISNKRNQQLAEKILTTLATNRDLVPYQLMVEMIANENNIPAENIAAALAYLMQQSNPLPATELQSAEPEARKPAKKSFHHKPNKSGSGKSFHAKKGGAGNHGHAPAKKKKSYGKR